MEIVPHPATCGTSQPLRRDQRVNTPDGPGTITDVEHYNRLEGGTNRYGVTLDTARFFYPVAYYWPKELSSHHAAR